MNLSNFTNSCDGYNLVLTHTTTDFDSLASAVGLAKLWSHQNPNIECYVVMPRGAHPGVTEFLSLHMNMFPIRVATSLDPKLVKKLGVVDAQRKDRLGDVGCEFVSFAEEITVLDHHTSKDSDLNPKTYIVDSVGSVTTLVTELLMRENVRLTDAEATLLALGIHSDTGSLTYDSSTARDAQCLAWLMGNGANQQVISQYSHLSLSPELQHFLMESFQKLNQTRHNGVTIGSVLLSSERYVSGLSRVAQNLLELTGSDVILLGLVYKNKPSKPRETLVIIGRAQSRLTQAVNLNALLSPLGGGGHAKAAAVNVKLYDAKLKPPFSNSSATEVMHSLVGLLKEHQLTTKETTVGDIMSSPVLACKMSTSVESVSQTIKRYRIQGMPVISDDKIVVGYISTQVIDSVMRQVHKKPGLTVAGIVLPKMPAVDIDAPLHVVERIFLQEDCNCVTVEQNNKLIGVVSRTDVLRQQHFYETVPSKIHFTPATQPSDKVNAYEQHLNFDNSGMDFVFAEMLG